MSRTVWKFPAPRPLTLATQHLRDPRVVHFATDPATGEPAVWIEHDSEGELVELWLTVIGTGYPAPSDAFHAGTCIQAPYVWHLYTKAVQ